MRLSRNRRPVSGRFINWRKFILYCFPLICWLFVIFYMSAQPYEDQDLRPWIHNSSLDEKVEKPLSKIQIHYGGREISVQQMGSAAMLEFFIRKLAHLLEYMVLGILVLRLLAVLCRIQIPFLLLISLVICSLYAALDELHQHYTGGRTPMAVDVLLDTSGAALGIMTYFLYRHLLKGRGDKT